MASRSSIYTWKRQENKPVFSLRGNVQDWVKQVQKACDDGAKDIFGDNVREILDRRDFYVDDDAISEGQDLIDSWIQKKSVDELLTDCEIQDEVSSISLPGYNKELAQNEKESSSLFYLSHNNYHNDEVEVQKTAFELDDNFDEELAVHEVVYNMLERDVVDLKSVNDQSMYKAKTKKFRDPTPMMKLRHQQVKKRANQRKLAWEKANLKKMNAKTVEEEARKQLQREEKQRLENMKREEDEIRKEMVKIRRVMQEENAQRAKHYTRIAESDEKVTKLAEDEVRKHQERNKEKLRREAEGKETMIKTLLKQQEEEEIKKQKNLKLLQRCFTSWYALVVSKEIKCGKARALLEWRRKLRIWNAWRTYVLRSRSDRETRALNEEMKERHRKEVLADRFYRQMLFHRCLAAWLFWVHKAKEDRMLKEQHDKRAEKMATLLKAASSGQLWQVKKTEEGSESERNADEELEQIEPFKLENLPQGSENPSIPLRATKKKENTQRQAWPHQKLQEMKNRKPKKKQNALLENIGFLTARTQSSATPCKDSLHIEDLTSREEFITPNENKPLSNRKSVVLHSQDLRSNIVEKSESSKSVQRVVDTGENITQAKSVFEDNFSTHVATEGCKPPQSIRSTSSTGSKSKVMSTKPLTKTLHLAMEERAKARAERKSLLEAKKRAAEEEKLAKLKQEQEEKEREILAEKQAALQRRKEEMKVAKQRELEKQQRLAEIREMNKKADEHYHKTLLKKFGFLPWKKLISTRNELMNNAELLHKRNLQNACFRNWLAHTRSECQRRNQLANNMRKTFLLRCGLQSWKKYRNHLVEIDKVALQFARRHIVKKYIKIWQDFVIEERLLYWDKENRAEEHNDKRLLRKAMKYWKKYIPLLREEAKREKRRNDLRKHVSSLLPDFRALHANHSP